jgi:hypothetical protein
MTGATRFCEQCGNPLGEEVAFCESCGTPVPSEAPPTPIPDAAIATVATVAEPATVAVASPATAPPPAGRGSPRWIPLVIGILGVLIIVAAIVSAL